jgi:hypothetical protein
MLRLNHIDLWIIREKTHHSPQGNILGAQNNHVLESLLLNKLKFRSDEN